MRHEHSNTYPLAAILLASLCLWAGCGKKEEPPMNQAPPRPTPHGPHAALQAELNRFGNLPHEHDPSKRPLVISERAATWRDWLLEVLERGYTQSGHTNTSWDAQVHHTFAAYADYVHAGTTAEHFSLLTNAVIAATKMCCDDPMFQYMRVRYGLADAGGAQDSFALASLAAFRGMLTSHYHPALKFISGYRATEAATQADEKGNRGYLLDFVTAQLEDLARDTNAPSDEVFTSAFMWAEHSNGKNWLDHVMKTVLPLVEQNWGQEEPCFRLRGKTEVGLAWHDRGSGFANTVSEQGWEGFRQHLQAAEQALSKAWQMNSSNAYTAYLMMQVELGQGQGRPRMEKWFRRAMALAPDYYDAVSLMSFYLEPRWYGSDDKALEFARSCVASTNWTGKVPLIVPNLYHSLAKYHKCEDSADYWQQPKVWDDINAAYEKFFKLHPEAFGWRHEYARDAYLCGHYAEFLQQTKLFSGGTNFAFFGGEEKFAEMLKRAAARSSGSSQP